MYNEHYGVNILESDTDTRSTEHHNAMWCCEHGFTTYGCSSEYGTLSEVVDYARNYTDDGQIVLVCVDDGYNSGYCYEKLTVNEAAAILN